VKTRNLILVAALTLAAGCVRLGGGPGENAAVYEHRVKEGETLESVSRQYYLESGQSDRIAEFNLITDEEITPGMTLRVPMTEPEVERLKTREKARVPYNKGLSLAENGAYIDAVQHFKEALEVDPEFADAHYNTGVSLQMMKSYDKATDSFERAIRYDPENPDYQYALGSCYFHQQSYRSAADAFERTIELRASYLKALYSLAVCYEKLERPEKARETWRRYLEFDDDSVWATEARKHLADLK